MPKDPKCCLQQQNPSIHVLLYYVHLSLLLNGVVLLSIVGNVWSSSSSQVLHVGQKCKRLADTRNVVLAKKQQSNLGFCIREADIV